MMVPFVEDLIVVRRRVRIFDGRAQQLLEVFTTARDQDVVISVLEQGKLAVVQRKYSHLPELTVEGLPGESGEPGGGTQ